MAETRVTQVVGEVVSGASPTVRVTQVVLEVITRPETVDPNTFVIGTETVSFSDSNPTFLFEGGQNIDAGSETVAWVDGPVVFSFQDSQFIDLAESISWIESAVVTVFENIVIAVSDTVAFSDEINPVTVTTAKANADPGDREVLLATISLDAGDSYYGQHVVRHPTRVYEGRVLGAGGLDRAISVPANLPIIGSGTISIADEDSAIRNALNTDTPIRRLAELRLGPEGESLATFGVPYKGEITNPVSRHGVTELPLRDVTFAWLQEKIPMLGTPDNFPDMERGNFFVPIIVGDVNTAATQSNRGAITLKLIDSTANKYIVARHPIESVTIFRKTPTDAVFTEVPDFAYSVSQAPKTINGITYNCTFVSFPQAQVEGTQIRADVRGMVGRPAWGAFDAIPDTVLIDNVVDFIVNVLFYIEQKETDITRYDISRFADTRQVFEDFAYLCDGALVEQVTYGNLVSQLATSFNLDFFQNRFAQIAIDIAQDPPADVPQYTDTLHIIEGSVQQDWPNPFYTRIRYKFNKHYAEGNFPNENTFDNAEDQASLAGTQGGDGVEQESIEMLWVRDSVVADNVASERSSWVDLQSYRITLDLPAPLVHREVDLTDYIGITHYAGIPTGGWTEEAFRVVGISLDVSTMVYRLTLARKLAPPPVPVRTRVTQEDLCASLDARVGPFRSQTPGEFFGVWLDENDKSKLVVTYSVDYGKNWFLLDSANAPDLTNSIVGHDAVASGGTLHISTQEATSGRVAYHTVDMVTKTWTIVNEQVLASVTTPATTLLHAQIAVRGISGTPVIGFQGEADTVSSVNYARVKVAWRNTAGTWSSPIAAGDATSAHNWRLDRLVPSPDSDRVHVIINSHRTSVPKLWVHTFKSDNAMSGIPARISNPNHAPTFPSGDPVAVSGSVTILAAGTFNKTNLYRWGDDDQPWKILDTDEADLLNAQTVVNSGSEWAGLLDDECRSSFCQATVRRIQGKWRVAALQYLGFSAPIYCVPSTDPPNGVWTITQAGPSGSGLSRNSHGAFEIYEEDGQIWIASFFGNRTIHSYFQLVRVDRDLPVTLTMDEWLDLMT